MGETLTADRATLTSRVDPEQRLAELFDGHHRRLYRIAARMVSDREEARDLVQEAFLRAARRADDIPGTASGAEAWLVRVVVNLCRDHLRRRKVRAAHRRRERRESEPSVEGEPASVARAAVRDALTRLSARRRAVVVLCELEEMTAREAAGLLGISTVTVRWHLAAARKQLAALLLPSDLEDDG